jgi:hypothetical protein
MPLPPRTGRLLRAAASAAAIASSAALGCRSSSDAAPTQEADPAFDPAVAAPAYAAPGPRVVVDEAHRNFHTAGGRYRPFAELLRRDGYTVEPGKRPFTAAALSDAAVLVTVNARGPEGAASSAFTEDEAVAVEAWVREGGALLLVADHAPYGEASAALAERFGVDMRSAWTRDPARSSRGDVSSLVFSSDDGLLGDHPITRGRVEGERVSRVLSFTGQSLGVPPGSTPLLLLGEGAYDVPSPRSDERTRAAGRAQGVALLAGRGRVVVLGEAAMLTAQIAVGAKGGGEPLRFGMNVPGSDNRQFALNVLHWLSRAPEPSPAGLAGSPKLP